MTRSARLATPKMPAPHEPSPISQSLKLSRPSPIGGQIHRQIAAKAIETYDIDTDAEAPWLT